MFNKERCEKNERKVREAPFMVASRLTKSGQLQSTILIGKAAFDCPNQATKIR